MSRPSRNGPATRRSRRLTDYNPDTFPRAPKEDRVTGPRRPARIVRSHRRDRPWRDGGGVPGAGHQAGSGRRLKVLPDAFTSDPDRLARFEREAKVLASLNHPNIGHIYGFEKDEAEGTKALVLELVEGPTLADRIAEGRIPVDDALPIAKQIAEALEAAHEQGIIRVS